MHGAIGPSTRPKSNLTITNPLKLVTKPIESKVSVKQIHRINSEVDSLPCNVTIIPQIVRRVGIRILGPIQRRIRLEGNSEAIYGLKKGFHSKKKMTTGIDVDSHEEHCKTDLVLCIRHFKFFLQPSNASVSCRVATISSTSLLSAWYKTYRYLLGPSRSSIHFRTELTRETAGNTHQEGK